MTKKEAYIDEVVESIEKILNEELVHRVSTCDAKGWDTELHYLMPAIAEKLMEKGYTVTSSVNHGVTDWVIIAK